MRYYIDLNLFGKEEQKNYVYYKLDQDMVIHEVMSYKEVMRFIKVKDL
jgi:hypothetical protein